MTTSKFWEHYNLHTLRYARVFGGRFSGPLKRIESSLCHTWVSPGTSNPITNFRLCVQTAIAAYLRRNPCVVQCHTPLGTIQATIDPILDCLFGGRCRSKILPPTPRSQFLLDTRRARIHS